MFKEVKQIKEYYCVMGLVQRAHGYTVCILMTIVAIAPAHIRSH